MGAKTLLTLEEFEALPDDGNKYELNQGELVVMPGPKSKHTRIIQCINRILSAYVYERRIGEVYSEGAYLLTREPEITIRQPDVSFLSAGRVKATGADDYFRGSPELAVEVVSPGNDAEELEVKVKQYLTYGSTEVWVVYPKTRSVWVYRADSLAHKVSDGDTVTFELFPGWSARVADFFDLDY